MRLVLPGAGLLVVIAALSVPGCGSDQETKPNLPPSASWVARPDTVSDLPGDATFRWTATDPDGEVVRYEVSLDSETDFTSTPDTVRVFSFTSADGSVDAPRTHVIRVRPFDNDGLGGELLQDAFVVALPVVGPSVLVTGAPNPGTPVTDPQATFSWRTADPGATVLRYEYSLDSVVDVVPTLDTLVTLPLTRADGSDVLPQDHVFRVRAVDGDGAPGVFAEASFRVAIFDIPPRVAFVQVPPADTYVGPVVSFAWTGSDPDGEVVGFEYAIDDTAAGNWASTPDTTAAVDFSTRVRGITNLANITREFTLFLRSVDDDGKTSPVVSTSFISGPANIPPIVNFTVLPETLVTSVGVWEWEGIDSDGEVLFYEWVLDRDQGGQWQRTTDLRREIAFGPEDGTPDNPEFHSFSLRAMDDDSTWSSILTDFFQVGVDPGLGPEVSIVDPPDPGIPITESLVTFRWTGMPTEAPIDRYQVSIDGFVNVETVFDTTVTLAFTRADGSDVNPREHVFQVRGVDVNEAVGPAAGAPFTIAIFDEPPSVEFVDPPPNDEYVGPVVTLRWSGSDPDGEVAGYEYVLSDTSADWTFTIETSVDLDFSEPDPNPGPQAVPGHREKVYWFFVRALDDDGKRSPPAETVFLSGPANRPPTLEFTRRPVGVVTGGAVWEWQGSDSDGRLIRQEVAFDPLSEADWRPVSDNVLERTFTAFDGSARNPRDHVLQLRAIDNDSTWSPILADTFRVGVEPDPVGVSFISLPDPDTPTLYRTTLFWDAVGSVASVEVALNDTATWIPLPGGADRHEFVFPCPDPGFADPGPPYPIVSGAPIDSAFGRSSAYVRVIDVDGKRSGTAAASVLGWTRTPFTRNPSPAGPDVTRNPGEPLQWEGLDVDVPPDVDPTRSPVGYAVKVFPVADFAQAPDAQAAVDADPSPWTDLAPGVASWPVSVPGPGRYVVAVRARDEAGAVEPYFEYGRNAWKLTVP